MKRSSLHLILALLTFGIGTTLTIMRDSNTGMKMEQASKGLESERAISIPITPEQVHPRASTNLAADLERVDKIYKKRCQVPDLSGGGWPAVKDLEIFKSCNDEWAKARREAIYAAYKPLLIRY